MLSTSIILKMIREKGLISFPDNDLGITLESRIEEGIEGSIWDLTVDDIYFSFTSCNCNDVYIGRETRKLPEYQPCHNESLRKAGEAWTLAPGYYLVKSLETITMPLECSGLVIPRTSVFRGKMIPTGTRIAPGYSGNIVTGLYVPLSSSSVTIERGARLMAVQFDALQMLIESSVVTASGNSAPTQEQIAKAVGAYKGIWHSNKITTNGTERAF